ISNQLNANANGDIRGEYKNTNLKDDWAGYQGTLKGMTYASSVPPDAPFTEADFDAVQAALYPELGYVGTVIGLFSNMDDLASRIQTVQETDLPKAWEN